MPTYEYWCPRCKKEFELQRPMAEYNKPASCPDCGAEGRKLVSSVAAKTDYLIKVPEKPPFRGEKR